METLCLNGWGISDEEAAQLRSLAIQGQLKKLELNDTNMDSEIQNTLRVILLNKQAKK